MFATCYFHDIAKFAKFTKGRAHEKYWFYSIVHLMKQKATWRGKLKCCCCCFVLFDATLYENDEGY